MSVSDMPIPAESMDPDEYRKMLLIMLVRTMNNAWSSMEELYKEVPPTYDRKHAEIRMVASMPGCELYWPHPQTTSPDFMLFEFGAKVGPGNELPNPGPWEYVGDELTRVLLTCSEGRPSKILSYIEEFNRIRLWAEDTAAAERAKKAGVTA